MPHTVKFSLGNLDFTIESKVQVFVTVILPPLLKHIFYEMGLIEQMMQLEAETSRSRKELRRKHGMVTTTSPNSASRIWPQNLTHPDITDIWCQIFFKILPSFSLSNLSKPELCWSNPTFLKPSVTVFEAQISVTFFASLDLHGRLRWHNRRPEVGKLSSDRGPGHWRYLGQLGLSIVYL